MVIIAACLLLFACNNNADKEVVISIDSTAGNSDISSWAPDLDDTTGRLVMKKVTTDGPDTLSVSSVIEFLNRTNPNVQLFLTRTSGDTIYIHIPQADYLTQQMGSTGPTMYFANAVYNLTEVPGYHVVNFDFIEGDHAMPGPLNRESFKDE